ncbi:MAG: FAD-dependent thymidylate synthase [Actinomycetia bacterium]|nr:FAD-dependent thymidylate synthase [Actinomycetes bacterium]
MRVLDHGYVICHGVFGSDLTVVNAARASYGVRHTTFDERDRRLLRYLWVHGHTSPFYHPKLQFEVSAPLMVARQWWKHVVDSAHTMETPAWNELSRRYTVAEPTFYIPAEWRRASATNKQASAEPLDPAASSRWADRLRAHVEAGLALYREALADGIAAEQARAFLPANIQYTTWYWTASLYAVLHFLRLRQHADAQVEIQAYARAIAGIVADAFPETWAVVREHPEPGR